MANKQLEKEEIIAKLKQNIEVIRKFSVKKLGLFGSFSRGEQKKDSDLDFLVEFENTTFDNYMDLKFFLENLFGKKIDLVIQRSLRKEFDYVKKEALYV